MDIRGLEAEQLSCAAAAAEMDNESEAGSVWRRIRKKMRVYAAWRGVVDMRCDFAQNVGLKESMMLMDKEAAQR